MASKWAPNSWRSKNIIQVPVYTNETALRAVEKTLQDSRFDYAHEEPEDTTDTEEYWGANGFTRMRIWQKELKGYNPETMENEDDL